MPGLFCRLGAGSGAILAVGAASEGTSPFQATSTDAAEETLGSDVVIVRVVPSGDSTAGPSEVPLTASSGMASRTGSGSASWSVIL